MLFDLSNPYTHERYREYTEKLLKDGAAVEITRKRPARGMRQNAYLHLILGYFALQYGCSLDEVKVDFYKRTCNHDLFVREKTNPATGRRIRFLRSTSSLTTAEMSLSIDRFRDWASAEGGIYLPSADDHKMMEFARAEVERAKEYIQMDE